jgi:protein ImuB
VALPMLQLEIAGVSGRPAGVVITRRGDERTENKLTGNVRLDEVSPEAHAYGVRIGQTIAQARSRIASLEVRIVREDDARRTLERLAEVLLAFGSPVSFDAQTLYVDVTTSGLLFTPDSVRDAMKKTGHAHRIAVAPGPALARAFAHYGSKDVLELPVEALGAELGDAIQWLARLGLHRIGDLRKVPRRALGNRLGDRAARVFALLDGLDPTPLTPYIPPETPSETIELEYGTDSTEAILFVAKTLCERIAQRLEGRAMQTSKMELVLGLDRALVPAGESRSIPVACVLPSPMHRASDLFGVLRARLDGIELPAPVLGCTLRALEISPQHGRPLHLFAAESKAEKHLAQITAELGALIGDARVGTIEAFDTFDPDKRTRLVPIARPRAKKPTSIPSSPEPLRWLRVPLVHEPAEIPPVLLVRTAYVEWWRSPSRVSSYLAEWDARGELACVRGDRVVGWMG